jgi:pyridoxamine 5'-phosphate oxidase
MALAERRGAPIPDAMVLATASRDGRPSARFVLLKKATNDGFVFFTDGRSPKARDLRVNPRAALVFYWESVRRQVRIEGRVMEVSPEEADAYWVTRPRSSRIAASVSKQSEPGSRALLLARFREMKARLRGHEIPRPRYWTGFRLRPETIEFWSYRAHRLHDRERFVRRGSGWRVTRLQP